MRNFLTIVVGKAIFNLFWEDGGNSTWLAHISGKVLIVELSYKHQLFKQLGFFYLFLKEKDFYFIF